MNRNAALASALMALCIAVVPAGSRTFGAQNVENTVHNLSATGTGTFTVPAVGEICVFCHTPHNATPATPLWNRYEGGQTYDPYQSTTLQASPGQPTGKSRLCLSCHDGTVALSAIRNQPGETYADFGSLFLSGRALLGTYLRDDHPVSFTFDASLRAADGELADPASIDLPLESGQVQCTSCHDPHEADIRPFLRKSSMSGELCVTCHDRGGTSWSWTACSHATSSATWNGSGTDPWGERKAEWKATTVATNACFNCHTPHTGGGSSRLQKKVEEQTCFLCHTGTVASKNIQAEFSKSYRHPVTITPNASHDAMLSENPTSMSLHAECMDCHNPHAAKSDPYMISFNPSNPSNTNHSIAPDANGRIKGVGGIDISGSVISEISRQYELCLKCHGVPGSSSCGTQRCPTPRSYQMTRLDGVYNIREKVDFGDALLYSYHPLAANNPSNNDEVPSLKTGIQLDKITSMVYCTDCHNNNAGPAAGSTGPAGPHGSTREGLLALRYNFNPNPGSYQSSDAEICYKCHSEDKLVNQEASGFLHDRHVKNREKMCVNCHDPHGSYAAPHLINFLTNAWYGGTTYSITGAGSYSQPTFIDYGKYRGKCFLRCHGETHNPRCYTETDSGKDASECASLLP
ncbi:MAG: hypothetical protein HYV63_00825 [Candidatus Schekmanbacteria bacterium]|nr:hypothetical protein [Candidatus Schekmanbacteria bacterium]